MKVNLLHCHILENPWLIFYNLKIMSIFFTMVTEVLDGTAFAISPISPYCSLTHIPLPSLEYLMDISYIRCSGRMLHFLPNELFLHLSKQRHRSPRCSRHFVILYIKPNNKSCWLHLWSLSWTSSISPNFHCFSLMQAYIIFHWDSCNKLLTHPASTLPFCSLFST